MGLLSYRTYVVCFGSDFTAYANCYSWISKRNYVFHYCDAIIGTIASQITSLTIVYTTVYSDADQSKHQSSASLAFVRGIHRDRWVPRTNGQLRGKCFHLITSSCGNMALMCQPSSDFSFPPFVTFVISNTPVSNQSAWYLFRCVCNVNISLLIGWLFVLRYQYGISLYKAAWLLTLWTNMKNNCSLLLNNVLNMKAYFVS